MRKAWLHLSIFFFGLLLAACGPQLTASPSASTPAVSQPTVETAAASPTAAAADDADVQPTAVPVPTPEGLQARINDFVNEVVSRPLAESDWSAAQLAQIIYQGGSVWAKESSTARLNLEEKLLRVAPNTIFSLTQPGDDKLRVNLEDGRVWMNVEGMPAGEEVEVVTPNTVASVRGTRFSVHYNPISGETTISSQDGQVDVSRPDGTFLASVTAGTMLTATLQTFGSVISLTPAETISWGMAYGPDLNIIFPGAISGPAREHDFAVYDPTISGDGEKLLYTLPTEDGLSTETLVDLSTGSESPAEIPPGSFGFVYAPTGQRVGYFNFPVDGSGGESFCQKDFQTNTTDCLPVPANNSLDSSSVKWNSTSDKVLATGLVLPGGFGGGMLGFGLNLFLQPQIPQLNSSLVFFIDFTNLTIGALPPPGPGALSNPVWSPDEQQIAFILRQEGVPGGNLYVAELTGRNPQVITRGISTNENSLLWSPDGQWLVYSDPNGGIWRIQPDGSQQEQIGAYPLEEGTPFLVKAPTPTGWPLYIRMQAMGMGGSAGNVYVLPEPNSELVFLTKASYGPMFAGNGESAGFALIEGAPGEEQHTSIFFIDLNPAFLTPSP